MTTRDLLVAMAVATLAACGGNNKFAEVDTDTEADTTGDVEMDTGLDTPEDSTSDGDDATGDSTEDTSGDAVTDGEEDSVADIVEDPVEDSVADIVEDPVADTVVDTAVDVPVDTVTDAGCTSDAECDDLDQCTLDTCDTSDGTCDHAVVEGLSCNDLDSCTVGETCSSSGACVGAHVTCGPSYPCPVADAGADVVVDADTAFSLDATGTTNPGGGSLDWLWEGEAGAPELAGADTATASGMATVCGTFTYTLTVTEPCGLVSTDTVVLTVEANGPYVSSTTCDPAMECGTVARPWCTVQHGIDASATSPVMVAGVAGVAYVEAPVMADGMDVLGGYEPTFTALRDPDPATNDTAIHLTGASVSWPASVAAVLDGFTVRQVDSSVSPSPDRTHVTAVGSATVVLQNDRLDSTLSTPVTGSATGVAVGAGTGGSLTIEGSVIEMPAAANACSGVLTVPTFDGDVVITDTDIACAQALTTGGVRHLGPGTLSVTGGSIDAGDADQTSRGIEASHASATILVDDATILGGSGRRSYGVDVQSVTSLQITGGSVTGGGEAGVGTTEAVGVDASGIGSGSITDASVTGARPVAAGTMQVGIGVRIAVGDTVPGPFVIVRSVVDGGQDAGQLVGVDSTSIPLTVQASQVSGSLVDGGYRAVGIHTAGSTPGITVIVEDNVSIVGGAPLTSSSGGAYQALGVEVTGTIPVRIAGNTLLQGCSPSCSGQGVSALNQGVGAGVAITGGSGHLVDGNTSIVGGPHEGVQTYTTHAGVRVLSSGISVTGLIGVELQGNGLVAGNMDPGLRPATAAGILARDVDLVTAGDEQVIGGHAADLAAGILVMARMSGTPNAVTVSDDVVRGGAATTTVGMSFDGTQMRALRNVIEGCGLASATPGSPARECLAVQKSWGVLGTENTLVHLTNNFVFGGFATDTTGCDIDPPALGPGVAGGTYLVYNLCLAEGQVAPGGGLTKAVGLRLHDFSGTSNQHVFVDNIIGAGDRARVRYGTEEAESVHSITFTSNDFVPDDFFLPSIALYLHFALGELDNAGLVNGLFSPPLVYGRNISVDPLFEAPDPSSPSAAGYHLGPACVLENLGEVTVHEEEDYDLQTRGDGATPTDLPEMGPDECP